MRPHFDGPVSKHRWRESTSIIRCLTTGSYYAAHWADGIRQTRRDWLAARGVGIMMVGAMFRIAPRDALFLGGFAMSTSPHRRDFMRTAAAGSIAGLGDLAFLSRLQPVTA